MRNFRNIFLTIVLAFVSVTVRGQFVGDLASIEALIADHKAQRKVLAVRSITFRRHRHQTGSISTSSLTSTVVPSTG